MRAWCHAAAGDHRSPQLTSGDVDVVRLLPACTGFIDRMRQAPRPRSTVTGDAQVRPTLDSYRSHRLSAVTDVAARTTPTGRWEDLGRRARLDAAVRLGSGVALWLSLLLVTFWWAEDRGVQDLSGWATGLVSTGRLTGLVASVLLLAQVLLMARVPVLEKAYGQDRLARVHRLVGFTSFNLMLAHVVLITWGYAAGQGPRHSGHVVEPRRRLPRHAAGRGRDGLPVPRRAHQRAGRAASDPVRVLAPAAPLRLPRRRPGAPPPALDRPAVRRIPGEDGLLVDHVGTGDRCRARCGGSPCPCGTTCGTGSG